MVQVGRIAEIWRYPVKSMAGERVPEAQLGALGMHADRMWAVRDVESDVTTSAKRLPGLLWCTARFAAPPPPDAGPGNAPEVIIGFPDGTEISSSDPGVHAALSAYVDRDVQLRPLPPLKDKGQYRGNMMTQADLRTVLGIDDGEPLPDLSMFPVKKLAEITMYATPVGSYVDAYPVHLVTDKSLRTIGALAPDSDFDVRRFRPTLLVEVDPDADPAAGSAADYPEWEWCGGILCTPGARLLPQIPTIRCVMPSHEQPQLKRDREISRTISVNSRRCLGVYGSVSQAGRIAEGDALDLIPAQRSRLAEVAGTGVARVKKVLMRAGTAAMPKGKS
jgi:hypothetical protein